MKRIEPNLLLAVSAALPLALLVLTGAVYGEPGQALKYAVIAVTCPVLFVLLNGLLQRGRPTRPPMIHPTVAGGAAWAGLIPTAMIVMAAVPVFFTGHDYGLLVIVAAVLMGLTLESAWKARRA